MHITCIIRDTNGCKQQSRLVQQLARYIKIHSYENNSIQPCTQQTQLITIWDQSGTSVTGYINSLPIVILISPGCI